MTKREIHSSEVRQSSGLLTAILKDAHLSGELSFLEKETLQGASAILRRLLPIVEVRDMEDHLNES